ncbi:hypothetical protein BDF19DRAFT_444888 [Syncephalis fuscata]|nr:hypothetical protein BDF19DRAFT_444888 [Syncephalis fuscata]
MTSPSTIKQPTITATANNTLPQRLVYRDISQEDIRDTTHSFNQLAQALENAPPLPDPDSIFNDEELQKTPDQDPNRPELLNPMSRRERANRRRTIGGDIMYDTQNERRGRLFNSEIADAATTRIGRKSTTPHITADRHRRDAWSVDRAARNSRRRDTEQPLGVSMLRSRLSLSSTSLPSPPSIKGVSGVRERRGRIEYQVTYRTVWEPADAVLADEQGERHINRFLNTVASAAKSPMKRTRLEEEEEEEEDYQ